MSKDKDEAPAGAGVKKLDREYFWTTVEVLIVIGLFLWLTWKLG